MISPEDIKEIAETLKAELVPAVTEQIKATVNGKIEKLTVKVDALAAISSEMQDQLAQQDINMAPAIETIQTLQSGRKFILWAVPVFAAVGAIIALVKRI